jgi:hypothetical protein
MGASEAQARGAFATHLTALSVMQTTSPIDDDVGLLFVQLHRTACKTSRARQK